MNVQKRQCSPRKNPSTPGRTKTKHCDSVPQFRAVVKRANPWRNCECGLHQTQRIVPQNFVRLIAEMLAILCATKFDKFRVAASPWQTVGDIGQIRRRAIKSVHLGCNMAWDNRREPVMTAICRYGLSGLRFQIGRAVTIADVRTRVTNWIQACDQWARFNGRFVRQAICWV
jgi:hypothetical protein